MLGIICLQDKIGKPKSGGNLVLFRGLIACGAGTVRSWNMEVNHEHERE
jgi:hypothetical protein